MSETKEKILQTSLYLFALEGYEAVSVSRIAEEIDITKGAVYKHYKSKRDIFNSIINRMKDLEKIKIPEISLPKKENFESLNEYYIRIYDIILNNTLIFFNFWTKEPFARDFRRMIMLEQFRNPEMNDLYQKYLVEGQYKKFEKIFDSLFIKNAKQIAYKYYSQVYFLIGLTDATESLDCSENILKENLKEFGEKYIFIKKQIVSEVSTQELKQKPKGLLQLAQEINN